MTGIGGQDGSFLAELLVAKGYDVTGVVRDPGDRPLPNLDAVRDRIAMVPGDLLDPITMIDALGAVRPHELYHLAAPTFVPDSWAYELSGRGFVPLVQSASAYEATFVGGPGRASR